MISKCAFCPDSIPTEQGGWKCRYYNSCHWDQADINRLIEKIFQKN